MLGCTRCGVRDNKVSGKVKYCGRWVGGCRLLRKGKFSNGV